MKITKNLMKVPIFNEKNLKALGMSSSKSFCTWARKRTELRGLWTTDSKNLNLGSPKLYERRASTMCMQCAIK